MEFKPDFLASVEQARQSDFRSVFTYQHPDAENIARLVETVKPKDADRYESFQRVWEMLMRYQDGFLGGDADFFREHLRNGMLLHLGGVATPFTQLRDANIKGVIHVDRFDPRLANNTIPPDPYQVVRQQESESGLKEWWVKADMLDVVSRIPNDSVNIQIDGIDRYIITNKAYQRALSRELVRILRPGGAIFGCNSEAIDGLSLQDGVQPARILSVEGATRVYTKTAL